MRRPLRVPFLAAILIGFAPSCIVPPMDDQGSLAQHDYELAEGDIGIVRLPATEPWPDFSIGWQRREELATAASYSLTYLSKPSSKTFFPYGEFGEITHQRVVASISRFSELLDESKSAEDFLEHLNEDFEVWVARGRTGAGDVYFNGYGTPMLRGSKTRGGDYQYPLYSKPDDLVKADDGKILGRPTGDGSFTTYWTHAELLENGRLDGYELVWLKNPFDAYIAHVQGSAVIELQDGELFEVGYAAKNGHAYRSIGMALVEEGVMTANQLSLQRLRDYFEANPAEADRVLPMNPSFVFFQESRGGPYGCLGQPVTAGHSIATDKEIFPRAALAYVEARLPDFTEEGDLVQRPTRFFAFDQDRGGAIRSAGRCDIYMGLGDQAMARAGYVSARGRMYYLFLKD
jgi:membrane-bound lytic murein transglycosylase A